MTTEQMIQALHANICGFQYNMLGDVDVTNIYLSFSENSPGACEFDTHLSTYGWLPPPAVNNCSFTFGNSSTP